MIKFILKKKILHHEEIKLLKKRDSRNQLQGFRHLVQVVTGYTSANKNFFVLSFKLSLFVFSKDFNKVSNLSFGSLASNKSLLYLFTFFSFLKLSWESRSQFLLSDSPKFSIELMSFSIFFDVFNFISFNFPPVSLNPPVKNYNKKKNYKPPRCWIKKKKNFIERTTPEMVESSLFMLPDFWVVSVSEVHSEFKDILLSSILSLLSVDLFFCFSLRMCDCRLAYLCEGFLSNCTVLLARFCWVVWYSVLPLFWIKIHLLNFMIVRILQKQVVKKNKSILKSFTYLYLNLEPIRKKFCLAFGPFTGAFKRKNAWCSTAHFHKCLQAFSLCNL